MDIKVSGRKTTVTDALRAHVDEKIGEALKVFDIEPMTVDVVLRYEKNVSVIDKDDNFKYPAVVKNYGLLSMDMIFYFNNN